MGVRLCPDSRNFAKTGRGAASLWTVLSTPPLRFAKITRGYRVSKIHLLTRNPISLDWEAEVAAAWDSDSDLDSDSDSDSDSDPDPDIDSETDSE